MLSIVQTLVRGDALWGQRDGVYAFTARLLLHGDDLYGHRPTPTADSPRRSVVYGGRLMIDGSPRRSASAPGSTTRPEATR